MPAGVHARDVDHDPGRRDVPAPAEERGLVPHEGRLLDARGPLLDQRGHDPYPGSGLGLSVHIRSDRMQHEIWERVQ